MIEFERRFLVNESTIDLVKRVAHLYYNISQGYVCADDNSIVRLRGSKRECGEVTWYITIKKDTGIKGKSFEFEYEVDDGQELFDTLDQKIEKTRYIVDMIGYPLQIEVDFFKGKCSGLVIEEVELENDPQSDWLTNNLPSWFGEEITGIKGYSNYSLCKKGLPK